MFAKFKIHWADYRGALFPFCSIGRFPIRFCRPFTLLLSQERWMERHTHSHLNCRAIKFNYVHKIYAVRCSLGRGVSCALQKQRAVGRAPETLICMTNSLPASNDLDARPSIARRMGFSAAHQGSGRGRMRAWGPRISKQFSLFTGKRLDHCFLHNTL